MRLPFRFMVLLVGVMILGSSALSAQVIIQPKQPPVNLRALSKKLLDNYEKLAQDPAYDVSDLKNARGELIRVLGSVGPQEKAIELCEQMLASDRKRGLYGEMSSTWVIQELGRLYTQAGLHEKAIAVNKEYVDWCARQYGEKASDTFAARVLLVKAYLAAKQDDRALALYKEAFNGMKQPSEQKLHMLGEIHSHYFISKQHEKQFDTLLELLKLQAAMRPAGTEPTSLPLRTSAAYTFIQAGKKDLAEKLIDHDWLRLRQANGPDDPRTLAALRISATDYHAVRHGEKAIARFGELVELLTNKSGADHLDTLTARNQLAEAHLGNNDTDKAHQLFQELYATTKEKLGTDNSLTGQVLYNLGSCLESAKKFGEAEPYLREYIEVQKKLTRANDSPKVSGSMAMLGLNLLKQEKWGVAERILRETLEIRRKKEPQLWTTSNTESLLGAALLGQKKYQDAEPLLLAGYNGLQQKRFFIPSFVQALRVNEALERLVRLYEATEQSDRAEQYRKLLKK